MVGCYEYVGRVGKAEIGKSLPNATKVLVGVLDRGERCGPIDSGSQLVEAVALIVLRSIRVARPKDEDERTVARFEERQHDLGGDIGEVVLLRGIGYLGPGGGCGAGLAVIAARGSSERNLSGGHGRLNFLRQGYAARASGRVVDYDRRRTGVIGVVEDQRRAELTDRGRADAGIARRLEQGHFV